GKSALDWDLSPLIGGEWTIRAPITTQRGFQRIRGAYHATLCLPLRHLRPVRCPPPLCSGTGTGILPGVLSAGAAGSDPARALSHIAGLAPGTGAGRAQCA